MYHCTTHFYLYRLDESIKKIITTMDSGRNFTFWFANKESLEEKELAKADVIFANVQGIDAVQTVKTITEKKKEEAQLIVLAGEEEAEILLKENLPSVEDIWILPMTQAKCLFRVNHWKRYYEMQMNFWEERNYLETTINSMNALVWYKDKEGAHIKVNDSFCKAVGKTKEQIHGRGHYYIWDLDPEEYAKGEFICMESEYEVMEKRHTCVFDENVKIGDEIRQFETYKSPLFDLDGSVMGTVGIANDVTQERLYQQMIVDNANTDFLTGLYNRRYLYRYMEEKDTKPLVVYYLDLDNFKKVNDHYGHQEGDRALVLTKEVLKNSMPDTVIARIGGDEFLVVQEGSFTEEEIEKNRLRLEKELGEAYKDWDSFQEISASIGTAFSPDGEETVLDKLIERADTMMYQEKWEKKSKAEKHD